MALEDGYVEIGGKKYQITYYAKLGWMIAVGRGLPTGAAHIAQVRIWRSTKFKKRGRRK